MNLKLLEVFCHAYEERSFSKAAQRADLTQPTVSSHIKTLEESLGTLLFDRAGRHVVPTSAGVLLYRYASQIVTLKSDALRAMDRLLNRMEGSVRLGCSTIPGEYILPAALGSFREQQPGIRVVLSVGDTQEVIEALVAGDVELAVVGAEVTAAKVGYQPIASDELVVVIPGSTSPALPCADTWSTVGDEVTADELRHLPFVVREEGSGSRSKMEACLRQIGLEIDDLNVVAEMGSTATVKQAVAHGLGVSFLSSLALGRDARDVRRVQIRGLAESSHRLFHLARNHERIESPLCEALAAFLVDLPTHAAALEPRAGVESNPCETASPALASS